MTRSIDLLANDDRPIAAPRVAAARDGHLIVRMEGLPADR
jgi:hypothetical protein